MIALLDTHEPNIGYHAVEVIGQKLGRDLGRNQSTQRLTRQCSRLGIDMTDSSIPFLVWRH